jgi:alkylation response protein AidB-like acyl-CoA dehydrogenase
VTTTVDRLLPTEDAEALLGLTRDICTKELAPQVHAMEEKAEFPEAAYRLLGRSGLLSLPFDEDLGGGGQPYEVYLQVVEEIATAWPSVGVGTSVHSLTANVVATNATDAMREEWLPKLLSGDWLGAYCLSEPQAGSDVSGIRTRAVRDGDHYVVNGTKQWISNGSCADYYILFARTSDDAPVGSASPPAPPASPRRRSRTRWRTPASAGSSGGPSATSRACSSCSRTWPPTSSGPGRRTSTPPGSRTPAAPTAARPAWRS